MKMIWVSFTKVGFHNYPDAPEEVKYLRDSHRHEFRFKVGLEVTDDNRQTEFHTFKRWLLCQQIFESDTFDNEINFGAKSCEMIAQNLLCDIESSETYGWLGGILIRKCFVEVSEDGENGGIVSNY